MNPQDQDLIAQASAQQLGVAAPAPQIAPSPQAAAPQPQESQPTPQEIAAQGVSPSTEGDKQSADAAQIMRIKFGEEDRELSEAQVKGTFDRYSALNFKHQNLKPVVDLAEKMLQAAQQKNPNASAKDLAKFMTAAAKAQTHNPQMGKGSQDPEDAARAQVVTSSGDVDDMMKQWEDDNAVSLPPRFRETMDGMAEMKAQNAELRDMLQQVIQGQQGVTESTNKQLDQSDSREGNVMQQRIGNNLQQAQSALDLPDDAEQEFMQFAYSRGYTVEDFIDPELTMMIAKDFKQNQDAPELERLRGITQKRQAFTGNASGTPAVSNQSLASSPDQTFIDSVINKTMTSRGQ